VALTPLPHSLDLIGAAEVIGVLRFGQPTSLTGALAGLPTRLLLTELLVMAITSIGKEDLSAAQAFHRGARKSTTRSRLARSTRPLQRAMTPRRTSIRKKE